MSFVNATSIFSTSGSTASGTVTATTGNALLISVAWSGQSSGGGVDTVARTLSDGVNTYHEDVFSVLGGGANTDGVSLFSAFNITGGTLTLTASCSHSAYGIELQVMEYSNVLASSALDSTPTTATGYSTAAAAGAITNTNTLDVFVAFMASESGNDPASIALTSTGWTSAASTNNGSLYYPQNLAYLQVTSNASQHATFTVDNNQWAVVQACYKISSGTSRIRDTPARFKVQAATAYRTTPARFRLNVLSWRDTPLRLRLQAVNQNWRDTSTRLRLRLQAWRDTAARFSVRLANARDTAVRLKLQSIATFHDSAVRFYLTSATQRWRDTSVRVGLFIHNVRDTAARFKLTPQTYLAFRNTALRYVVQLPVYLRYRDTLARFKLQLPSFASGRDTYARLKLASTLQWRDSPLRYRLQLLNQRWKDTAVRLRLATQQYRFTPLRFRVQLSTVAPVYWNSSTGAFQLTSSPTVVDWGETTGQFQPGA